MILAFCKVFGLGLNSAGGYVQVPWERSVNLCLRARVLLAMPLTQSNADSSGVMEVSRHAALRVKQDWAGRGGALAGGQT